MVKTAHEREEKKQKKIRIILGVLISVLMIGSIGGFFASDLSNNALEYKSKDGKKYSFSTGNSQYYTKINGQTIAFYTLPSDALQLNISSEASSLLKNAQVFYLTFDPTSKDIQYIEQARFDLEKDFLAKNRYYLTGVTKNSSAYANYPILTCKNSTVYTPVIYFAYANNTDTRGYVNNSCIIFEGKRDDFLRFRDYIVYGMYGVI